jgi:Fe-S-cluster containining protein
MSRANRLPQKDRQSEMFALIEKVYRLTEPAVMDCAGSCDGACETKMAETVLFLPYEREYIMDRVGLKESPFQQIELPSGQYGMMDYRKNCPFLIYKGCDIRPFRPLDCRSFPIYPWFPDSYDAPVEFYLAPYCPLKDDLTSQYIDCMLKSWEILLPHLPSDWKSFYNSLCYYQQKLRPKSGQP